MSQAICRVFARLGEKSNRARARLKFLVAKLGLDEFRRLVEEERKIIPPDERWTSYLDDLTPDDDRRARPDSPPRCRCDGDSPLARQRCHPPQHVAPDGAFDALALDQRAGAAAARLRHGAWCACRSATSPRASSARWRRSRASTTTVTCAPRSSRTSSCAGSPSATCRHSTVTSPRRAWRSPGASTLVDITACPGTDTCKLGISSSRGLAAELRAPRRGAQLPARRGGQGPPDQDLGLLQLVRPAPHRRHRLLRREPQGRQSHGAALPGHPRRPDRAATPPPTALPRWRCRRRRSPTRSSGCAASTCASARRARASRPSSSASARRACASCSTTSRAFPPTPTTSSYYSDWGDPREYTIGDMGVGECAGEVVSLVEFGLAASERIAFEALDDLEDGKPDDRGGQGAARDDAGGEGGDPDPEHRRRRRPGADRRRVQDALPRHRASSTIRSPARSSRTTSSTPTRSRSSRRLSRRRTSASKRRSSSSRRRTRSTTGPRPGGRAHDRGRGEDRSQGAGGAGALAGGARARDPGVPSLDPGALPRRADGRRRRLHARARWPGRRPGLPRRDLLARCRRRRARACSTAGAARPTPHSARSPRSTIGWRRCSAARWSPAAASSASAISPVSRSRLTASSSRSTIGAWAWRTAVSWRSALDRLAALALRRRAAAYRGDRRRRRRASGRDRAPRSCSRRRRAAVAARRRRHREGVMSAARRLRRARSGSSARVPVIPSSSPCAPPG